MTKSRLVAPVLLLALALGGCASPKSGLPVGRATPTSTSTSTSSLVPVPSPESVASTLVVAGDHLEIRSRDNAVMTSISYTAPAAVMLTALTGLFGKPTFTDYPDGDYCEAPRRTYSWDGGVTLIDTTGYASVPPRDQFPYLISITAAQLGGIKISTPVGLSVGDNATPYLVVRQDQDAYEALFLIEQSGVYVEQFNDQSEELPIGLYGYAANKAGPLEGIEAPAASVDVDHEC